MVEGFTELLIIPGKKAALEELCASLSGPKHAEFTESCKRHGITKERWFLVSGPGGDRCALYREAEDPAGSGKSFMTSKHPFDVWLLERIKECVDLDSNDPQIANPSRLIRSSRVLRVGD